MPGRRCPRCDEPVEPGSIRCGLCGALFRDPVAHPDRPALPEEWVGQAKASVRRWQNRYGTLPLLSLVGVLPFFPVTAVLGLALGGIAIRRVNRGYDPSQGRALAVVGMVAGALWLAVGIVLMLTAADYLRTAPFIPAPVKWLWNWQVG